MCWNLYTHTHTYIYPWPNKTMILFYALICHTWKKNYLKKIFYPMRASELCENHVKTTQTKHSEHTDEDREIASCAKWANIKYVCNSGWNFTNSKWRSIEIMLHICKCPGSETKLLNCYQHHLPLESCHQIGFLFKLSYSISLCKKH